VHSDCDPFSHKCNARQVSCIAVAGTAATCLVFELGRAICFGLLGYQLAFGCVTYAVNHACSVQDSIFSLFPLDSAVSATIADIQGVEFHAWIDTLQQHLSCSPPTVEASAGARSNSLNFKELLPAFNTSTLPRPCNAILLPSSKYSKCMSFCCGPMLWALKCLLICFALLEMLPDPRRAP
jgi:hypothetical protein